MLTQAMLLEQLERRGRPKTPRGLTDWRAKGFLPPLIQRGAGRGRGVCYGWADPDILKRAILVDDLLAEGVRGEQVVLLTWFAGHQANLGTIRKAWLAHLAVTTRRALRRRFYELEDWLGSLSQEMSLALASQFGVAAGDLDPVVFEALSAFHKPNYKFDVEDAAGFVETLKRVSIGENDVLPVTSDSLQQAFGFIQDRLSIASRESLMKSASDRELSDAHRRWRLFLKICLTFANAQNCGVTTDQMDELGRRLSVIAGPWCILALLYLGRSGTEGKLEQAERLLNNARQLAPEDAFEALARIWKESDEQELIGV